MPDEPSALKPAEAKTAANPAANPATPRSACN